MNSNRKDMPIKAQIVDCWAAFFADLSLEELRTYPCRMWIDWGEPDCWACGRYDPVYNDIFVFEPDKTKHTWKRILTMWNRANLVRHHVRPLSMDGNNHPLNLVLICETCHKSAPHTTSSEVFWRWMFNREQEVMDMQRSAAVKCTKLANLDLETATSALEHYIADGAFRDMVSKREDREWLVFSTQSLDATITARLISVFDAHTDFTARCKKVARNALQIPMEME